VIGAGDPAFGDERLAEARGESITAPFHAWADALKRGGVTHINGRLIFDDSIFDAEHVHPGWPADQYQTWYEAPIGGLNLSDNCVKVDAAPGRAGEPAKLTMTPGNALLKLVNRTRTSSENRLAAQRNRGSDTIVVSGTVKSSHSVELTVPDPGE